MKNLLKYLIFILIGVSIFVYLNKSDGFSVGSLGVAVLKAGRGASAGGAAGALEHNDYDFYYNPNYNEDKFREQFPDREIIFYPNFLRINSV